ncbi:unnamed protein product, partial [Tetraodon nigroviridis]
FLRLVLHRETRGKGTKDYKFQKVDEFEASGDSLPEKCISMERFKNESLKRRWEGAASGSCVPPPWSSAPFDFSVMSYNILSQELLQDNAYLYRHCDPGVLPWDHRLPNLLAEIRQHDADVTSVSTRSERGANRTAVQLSSSPRVSRSSRPIRLSFSALATPFWTGTTWDWSCCCEPSDAASPLGASSICVANTHLLYNPRRGDVKLAQLAILLAEISRLSRLPGGSTGPVVLCGDFNSTPLSPLYSFLTTGCLNYSGLKMGSVSGQESSPRGQRLLPCPIWSPSLGIDHRCQYRSEEEEDDAAAPAAEEASASSPTGSPSEPRPGDVPAPPHLLKIGHTLNLQSTYQHLLPPDGRPEITTHHSRTALTVDYIMYTPDTASCPDGRGLRLLDRLSLVGQAELEEVRGLPNHHHPSDHLPLLARFRL